MALALVTTEKIIEMFLILLVGVLAIRTKTVSPGLTQGLSSLLLNIVMPCMILMSYQVEFDFLLLQGLALTAGLSALSFGAAIAVARLAVREGPDSAVEKLAIGYSNCGFIGIPLANAVLGSQGVLYITAYILIYNLLIWSHGVLLMKGSAGTLRETIRNLIQPSLVAILVSLVLFLANVRLPAVLANPLDMLGDMNTPLAMLISGMNLAGSDLWGSLRRPRPYQIAALKLLVIPLLTALILRLFHPDPLISMTIVLATACPTGAMGTMFAVQYHKNSAYASELFTISTVLSLVTIPLVVLLSGMIL